MRAVSLLRAWIHGIGVFAAVTASLTLALSIAITGPPTASEMDDLQAFLSKAGSDLAAMAEQAGGEACVQLPPEATGSLCPQTAAAETAPAARAEDAPRTPAEEESIVIEAFRTENDGRETAAAEPLSERATSREDVLLGDIAGDPRARVDLARPPQPRAQAERPRQPDRAAQQRRPVRAAPPRAVQRAPRRPIAVARSEAIAPLPDSPATRALEDLIAASAPEILQHEPVTDEAAIEEAASEQVFEDVWPAEEERKPGADDEPPPDRIQEAWPAPWDAEEQDRAYEDEAYEEERAYAEQEARRRYRERRRAYREWRRDGW